MNKMNKLRLIFEYGYLVIAIVFLIDAILTWNENRNQAFLLFGFSVLAVGMYFFRRKYRRKAENSDRK